VDANGQVVDMGKIQNGVIALAMGASLVVGGALGASAQEDEGPNEEESSVPAGTLDDGADLVGQADITIDEAISAAQTAASGAIGEVDLEYVGNVLVYNVDVGTQDVKIDATTGEVVSVDMDD
jgi:uncharacterized membrane protein YkoI